MVKKVRMLANRNDILQKVGNIGRGEVVHVDVKLKADEDSHNGVEVQRGSKST